MQLRRTFVAALHTVLVSVAYGCESSMDPLEPSVPQVQGTYAGILSLKATSIGDGGTVSIEFPLSGEFTVVQSGAQLTIRGTLEFFGETVPVPTIQGTIDTTGSFSETGGGALATLISDEDLSEDCGAITSRSSSINFSSGSMQIQASAETASCSNELSGTLTRG